MARTSHSAPLTPAEKKRLRDRKAQKTLREKKESRFKYLEECLAFCEKHHGSARTQCSSGTTEYLRRENELLRGRLDRLRKMLASWAEDDNDNTGLTRLRLEHRTNNHNSNTLAHTQDPSLRPGSTKDGLGALAAPKVPSSGAFSRPVIIDDERTRAPTLFCPFEDGSTATTDSVTPVDLPSWPTYSLIQASPATTPSWSLIWLSIVLLNHVH
ncbi:hypothetical protein BBP40_010357 [Aspergillus hancockii]|nr:hypothetical protein BBP40_010357 [Aspergillus hancockii]